MTQLSLPPALTRFTPEQLQAAGDLLVLAAAQLRKTKVQQRLAALLAEDEKLADHETTLREHAQMLEGEKKDYETLLSRHLAGASAPASVGAEQPPQTTPHLLPETPPLSQEAPTGAPPGATSLEATPVSQSPVQEVSASVVAVEEPPVPLPEQEGGAPQVPEAALSGAAWAQTPETEDPAQDDHTPQLRRTTTLVRRKPTA